MAELTLPDSFKSTSSNIKSVLFDEESSDDQTVTFMDVTFQNGRTYRYWDVPQEVYEDLKRAERSPKQSVGKMFASKVRNAGFEYEELS